ncbi:MAG TPA: M56 family metallopeptidase [Solirubrobacterales bacterium]|jgi:Zn-dependent protease with chaperone function
MSTAAILAPLIVAAALRLLGRELARRLPPRDATWLISVGAVVSALSAMAVLLLLAAALVGRFPGLAGIGNWSNATLREDSPIGPGLGALALLAAAGGAAAMLFVAIRRARAMAAASRACRGIAGDVDLVVIDEPERSAFASPGWPGRVVVTRSLLRLLSPGERRVLLAHERAHLENRHFWHRTAVAVAIASNPLLRPLGGAVAYATERWADEQAAAALGDRGDAARALARVALLSSRSSEEHPRLAASQFAVPARVSALLADPPPRRPVLTLITIALLAIAIAAAVAVEMRVENVFDLAVHVHRMGRGG